MKKSKKLILIIEDEKIACDALQNKFAREGFNTLCAGNGRDGISKAIKYSPDLILMDIIMPVMDGITALKKIRANKKISKIPVIILTNLSDSEKVEIAMASGVSDFLIKTDWTLAALVKKVKNKLGN